MTPDQTGAMAGHGEYGHHSLAQHTAGAYGFPMWSRAIDDVTGIVARDRPVIIADLGAAGGRNELAPMRIATDGLRSAEIDMPIVVVHTDIPTNDFTALFETVESDPDTYLGASDVFAFAAGRSFYERIFPAATVSLAWTAIAVHWLSGVPAPLPDHVYCEFATGATRNAFQEQSAADWEAFLAARAVELCPGAQLVVVGGAAAADGSSGAARLMDSVNDGVRAEVASGALTADEYLAMNVPTWNRTLTEFVAPFGPDGSATEAGLALLEQDLVAVPDAYLAAYRDDDDASKFADAVSGFVRAFTEPSLFGDLDRPAAQRAAIADRVYAQVRAEAAADPEAFETIWHVALLRIKRVI
jgi:hypothetical protein